MNPPGPANSLGSCALSIDSVITPLELARQASTRDLERRREAQEAQRLAEERLACQIRVNAALAEELAAIRHLCEDACGFPVGSVVVAVRELLGPAREILDAARERRS